MKSFKHTVIACYIAYITQAIVNIFAPLLFVTFNTSFDIPLSKISLLITINFCIQILVDLASTKLVDKIGYRTSAILAHVFSGVGLILLGNLPYMMDPFCGIVISVVLYAVGGGLAEVIISPIVEACPGDEKEAAMSLLHSFYCWGCVLVVLVSTIAFKIFGIQNWRYISMFWAIIPLANIVNFAIVPINTLVSDDEKMSFKTLFTTPIFYILIIMMLAAGASELSMSQWVSAFAEAGLKVDKTTGDLLGSCLFAVLMGSSRIIHAKVAGKVDINKYLTACAILCIFSYLIAVFSPLPLLSLAGCALCGLSVGAMWPGTFSIASKACPKGGTALFAFLALAGDLGCSAGPTITGFVSSHFGDDLHKGLLVAIIFPILLIVGIFILRKQKTPENSEIKSN